MDGLGSFFMQLGFDVDPAGMDKFVDELMRATTWTAKLAGTLVVAAGGVALFAAKTAEALDELGDFAEREQIAVEALQELGFAAQLNGSSLESVKSSVAGVNTTLGQAAQGIGRAAALFKKLGFEATDAQGNVKSFDAFLMEVSDRMQGLSRQEQISLAEKLGFDRSLVPLLVKGRTEITKLRDEARKLGVTSQAQIDIASAWQDRIDKLRFKFLAWRNSIAVAVLPWLDKFLTKLEEMAPVIKEVARALLFVGAALAVIKIAQGLMQVGSVLAKLPQLLGLLLNPMFLMVALVALLIEDFMTWREGGESLIGSFMQSFPELTAAFGELWAAVNRLADVFMEHLWPIIKMVFQGWGEILKLLLPLVIKLVALIIDGLAAAITFVVEKIAALIDGIASVIDWFGDAIDAAKEFFGEIGADETSRGATLSTATGANVPVSPMALAAMPPMSILRGGTTTQSTMQTTNTVNIPGGITVVSPNPSEAGKSVREELNRVNKTAVRNEQSVVTL